MQEKVEASRSLQLSKVQPRNCMETLLGPMPVSQSGNNPAELPVIIQTAPIVMGILYYHLRYEEAMPAKNILGDVLCPETALRKTATVLAVLELRSQPQSSQARVYLLGIAAQRDVVSITHRFFEGCFVHG